MVPRYTHTRILSLPFGENTFTGARLDALCEQKRGTRTDLIVDFQQLKLTAAPQIFKNDGLLSEQIEGIYVPRRLRFGDAKFASDSGAPLKLDELPVDHPSRALSSSLQWRAPDGLNYYLIWLHAENQPDLLFTARHCSAEERSAPNQKTVYVRNWSPPPACTPRLVPILQALYHRYGGDPVSVKLHKALRKRRLFIGGVDIQPEKRPDVDAVLNLGELPSRWAGSEPLPACDRWMEKGEGSLGMDVDEIQQEAAWVVERLQSGQRVLVHCAAGMNRSATVCCAALILLEGLSAETALERIRECHPWARPDSHHWLALRWLAQTRGMPGE